MPTFRTTLALLLLASTAGCPVQTLALARVGHNGVEGGAVSVEGVVSKLRFGIETGYERVRSETDDEQHGVVGVDYTARLGIVAAMLESRCKEFCTVEPWVDLGPAAGVGFGTRTSEPDLLGHAWVGGWLNVRLWKPETYPVIRVEVQNDAYSGALRGDTQITLGLGFVTVPEVDSPWW